MPAMNIANPLPIPNRCLIPKLSHSSTHFTEFGHTQNSTNKYGMTNNTDIMGLYMIDSMQKIITLNAYIPNHALWLNILPLMSTSLFIRRLELHELY